MIRIKPYLFYISLSITMISCSRNQHDLRKLTPAENLQNIIDNIDNKKILDGSPVYMNTSGDTIYHDSISRMNSDSIGFDHYVDDNNEVRLVIVRDIKPKDIEANKRWDSLLTFDKALLMKFANLVAKDSIEKLEILNAYKAKVPIRTFPVNCDSTYYLLYMALEADQEVRALKQSHLYNAVDKKNQETLLSIIECCGFKGISKSGHESIHATFMILQHSPIALQKKYFPMLEEWSLQGFLKPSTLALMIDRIRIRNGEKQIFGYQVRRNNSNSWELLPIEHPERVNILRDSVGLGSLEDYLFRFGIEY